MEQALLRSLMRECWIEIDLDRIAYNVEQLKQMCGPHTKLGAVVKADAYGHGACQLADTLMAHGADLLCVATLSEALALKRQNAAYPVLIMGLTDPSLFEWILQYNLVQTIDSLAQAQALSKLAAALGKTAHIQIKLDTGFHRLGFPDNAQSFDEIAAICRLPMLAVDGIFTHLVLLDDASNEAQFQAFLRAKRELSARGITLPCWHIADSIAGVDFPQYRMDMIRTGALLYGLKGFHKGSLDVRQALSFKARITHISEVKKGEGVSYDFTWRAPKDTRVGTLPFGYADGYPRSLTHKGQVLLRGKRVPVIGIICMDQCMIDLSDVPEASLGDEVIVYGDGSDGSLSIQEISQLAGTNKNDIVARLSRRPPRVYLQGGEIVSVRTCLDP